MPFDTADERLAKALRVQPKTARLAGLLVDRAPGGAYTSDELCKLLGVGRKNLGTQISYARAVLPEGSIDTITSYAITDVGRSAIAAALGKYRAREQGPC